MGLLETAAADLRAILSDDVGGFALSVTVVDPDGRTAVVKGLQNDIGLTVDPQTGEAVVGRRASVALPIAAITAAGFPSLPFVVASKGKKPWIVRLTPPTGGMQSYKVAHVAPDSLGCLVCLLEEYVG